MTDRVARRTILFTALIPGTIVGVLPVLFLRSGLDPFVLPVETLRFAGAIPVAFGVGLYVASARAFVRHGRGTPAPFDPPRRLVTSGPYARLRNPIYVAVLAVLAGEAVLARSGGLLLYAIVLGGALHLRVVWREEPGLERQFGDGWHAYSAKVPRWIPGLTRTRG